MPKRKPTRLNFSLTYVVVSGDKPVTPAFYHRDLANSVVRELSTDTRTLEVREAPADTDGSFIDGAAMMEREMRWLDLARSDKRAFSALCDVWASMTPETATEVA